MRRRAVLTAGLGLSIVCALGVSASATVELATAHHMPPLIRPLLVGVLELLSLGCAWGWVTTTAGRTKVEFAGIMAGASSVSLVAGWAAYGWLGAFAPVALIAAVHVTSRMWADTATVPAAGRTTDFWETFPEVAPEAPPNEASEDHEVGQLAPPPMRTPSARTTPAS